MKRISAILACMLLTLASGCDLFPVPSKSAAPSDGPSASAVVSTPLPADSTAATETPTTAPEETPTEAPTETPEAEPTASGDQGDTPTAEGMIFPDSDKVLLKWKDLIVLTADKLDLARNEIYARAGYQFTKQTYIDYFSQFSWYKPDPNFSEKNFFETQLVNIKLLQIAEKAVKGQLTAISSGTTLDYDQDGQLENLTYTASDMKVTVKIKDGSTTTTWNIDCDTPSKKVYLGDINFKDGLLDLFVDEFGPSDDYAVYVAGLKHKAFLNRTAGGTLPGQIGELKLDGKGKIATTQRMNILMTWFCKVGYKLSSSGKIAFVPQSSYPMGDFKVKTTVDIPLKKTASASSAVLLTVPAGTEVKLVSTDDKKWVKIKAPAGTGWLEMADFSTLADPNIQASLAFDGLIMAD